MICESLKKQKIYNNNKIICKHNFSLKNYNNNNNNYNDKSI